VIHKQTNENNDTISGVGADEVKKQNKTKTRGIENDSWRGAVKIRNKQNENNYSNVTGLGQEDRGKPIGSLLLLFLGVGCGPSPSKWCRCMQPRE
jgi:hypothetical protein